MCAALRDLFIHDPVETHLANDGVADLEQDAALRQELSTFVCDGQYARGLERVLQSYLTHLHREQQPGVWVSGFYGSGKSHFVKMLLHLWADRPFSDGALPRGIARLSQGVKDALAELSTAGSRIGGLMAAGGKLNPERPLRRQLLAFLLDAAGLPTDYSTARLALWLKDEGVFEAVRQQVEAQGQDFERQLSRMYVSRSLARILSEVMPDFAADAAGAIGAIRAQFPQLEDRADIGDEQFVTVVRQALESQGQMPCTLLVLDEVQQYIGQDATRAYGIGLVAEALCKQFGSSLLLVCTGQSALAETPNLQRLQGRFAVQVQLSDTDVETVTRQLVLAKQPTRTAEIQEVLGRCSGEIDRQLRGTRIGPRPEDEQILVADYPILPARRRFWASVLRAVDRAGTQAQLRSQLRVTLEAVHSVAERPLGAIVPADFLYEQEHQHMLSSGVLLSDVHQTIEKQRDGTPEGTLRARLCALAFLIGQLPHDTGADTGIHATPETMADLMVDDLQVGNTELRRQVPALLDALVQAGDLLKTGDEYHVQTPEGAAWEAEYRRQLGAILGDAARIADERDQLLQRASRAALKDSTITQGESRTPRKLSLHFGLETPETGTDIPVWIRDEWSVPQDTVRAEAAQAGTDSPIVFVFLPRRDGDKLTEAIAGHLAATRTLELRGNATTDDARQAHQAMQTRAGQHEREIAQLVAGVLAEAHVYQGGGHQLTEGSLRADVEEAAKASVTRLFPSFHLADHARWSTVLDRAQKGALNALNVLNYQGEVQDHPVCRTVLETIGAGKRGSQVRTELAASPYGWPQDAVDASLALLVCTNHLIATDAGQPVAAAALNQTRIARADFRRTSVVLQTGQRVQLRKLLQDFGITCQQGEEVARVPELLQTARTARDEAGGDPPLPQHPAAPYLEELRGLTGNELAAAVLEQQDRLRADLETWKAAGELARERLPHWSNLGRLLHAAEDLTVAGEIRPQVEAIRQERQLLAATDPVRPLCDQLATVLREALNTQYAQYAGAHDDELGKLSQEPTWQALSEAQRQAIASKHGLQKAPPPDVGSEEAILAALADTPLRAWRDRTNALPKQVQDALLEAVRMLEPQAVAVPLPRRKVTNEAELQSWLKDVEERVRPHLEKGKPVML